MFGFFALLIHVVKRRPENYSIHLYFMSTLMVLGPIFVPYAGSSLTPLLIMLRMMVPIVALGSSTLVHLVSEYEPVVTKMRGIQIEKGLILISLLSFAYFVPAYSGFQGETVEAFLSADEAMVYYRGGTVVCDYPTMNYRFVNRWRMAASDLMGNHYAPNYFGVSDPREYARWLEENHVTLWIRSDYRAAPVWKVVEKNYPDLLVFLEEIEGSRFYSVNQTELERVLPREGAPS